MGAITAEILATLSDYTEEEVAGREARFSLAEDLRTTMNTALVELEGFGGIENSYRVQQPPLPPPMGYTAGLGAVPPPGGTGYPGFKIALQQGGLKPSSQAPSAGGAGGGGGGGGAGGGGGGWQISDDMMKQPWGAHTPHATRGSSSSLRTLPPCNPRRPP